MTAALWVIAVCQIARAITFALSERRAARLSAQLLDVVPRVIEGLLAPKRRRRKSATGDGPTMPIADTVTLQSPPAPTP